MSIENSHHSKLSDNVSFGNVYIMTHSIFSNVIRIGCTLSDTVEYAKSLSAKSPGHYDVFFSLACDTPCKVKKQLREHFDAKKYVNEFYDISPETAKSILQREAMKIPVLSMS